MGVRGKERPGGRGVGEVDESRIRHEEKQKIVSECQENEWECTAARWEVEEWEDSLGCPSDQG